MSQGVLGFKYEEEKGDTGMMGLTGLPVYLDLLHAMGLSELIRRHLQVKQRGWTDAQMVLSLMLLNIAGVEQVRLRSDTAGYQHSLLRYCEGGDDRRFGRIDFAVGADVTPEFKKAVLTEAGEKDWEPIYREFDGKRIQTTSFINIQGRIVERSRELIVRLVKGHPALELYLEARRRIMGMIPVPG